MNPGSRPLAVIRRRIAGPWFAMTPREQKAVSLVLLLFLLGLAVRIWRSRWS